MPSSRITGRSQNFCRVAGRSNPLKVEIWRSRRQGDMMKTFCFTVLLVAILCSSMATLAQTPSSTSDHNLVASDKIQEHRSVGGSSFALSDSATPVRFEDLVVRRDHSLPGAGIISRMNNCTDDRGGCSSDGECCSNACRGGSCCTPSGISCSNSSLCCTRQACGSDGRCP